MNEYGNIWAVIVSVRHKKVVELVKQAIAIGINPIRIIVVTNRDKTNTLTSLGVPPENILDKDPVDCRKEAAKAAKGMETVGYAGALIKGAEKVVQYDPGATLVNLSSEYKGNLADVSDLILSATLMVRRANTVIIGSTETEDGIAIWRVESLITAVTNGSIKKKGTKFKDLTAKLSQLTIL